MLHQHIKKLGFGLSICTLPFCTQAQILYNNGAVLYLNTGASMQVNGGMTNASGSDLNNNGTLNVTGILTNNQSMATSPGGTLNFSGNAAQTFSGSEPYRAGNVVVNNPAGISLNNKLVVSGNMTFTSGHIVAASTSSPLVFTNSGTHSGASNSSHVNGYVVKEGTGAFSYPVGNGVNLQKVDVNLSANGSGLQVKYNAADAGSGPYTTTGTEATPLAIYNTSEYWDISPLSTATGAVTIYWDNVNNIVSSTPSLRVAHKSGANWQNEGGLNITGNATAGSVSSNPLSTWSPFTLGATAVNALPVQLLDFTARSVPAGNLLEWASASEEPQTRYSIERSADAKTFIPMGTVQGLGGLKNSYSFLDEQPLSPVAYYRLHITEPGSDASYSPVRMVRYEGMSSWDVSPVPANDYLVIANTNTAFNGQMAWISDLQGKLIQSFNIGEQVRLNIGHLAAGMYLVHFPDGRIVKVIKE